MKTAIKFFTLAAFTCFFAPIENASALTMEFGFESGSFLPRYHHEGTHASDYEFRSVFDLSDLTLTLDTDTGDATVAGSFSGMLQDHDGNTIGTSTAELDMTFYDLTFNPDFVTEPTIAVGEAFKSTSEGTFSFVLDFNDRPLEAETINVYGGFASVNANHPTMGDLAGAAFNFLLRGNGQFDIWVKSHNDGPFTLFNDSFHLHGDVHGRAEVPEPGTLLLFGAALGGGLLRRRAVEEA